MQHPIAPAQCKAAGSVLRSLLAVVTGLAVTSSLAGCAAASRPAPLPESRATTLEADGTVRIAQLAVPLSSDISPEARRAFFAIAGNAAAAARKELTEASTADDILRYRGIMDREYYAPLVAAARKSFDVEIEERVIGGVRTDVVTPRGGMAPGMQGRVLVNLHGGAFRVGGGLGGLLESIPIAATAGIKVISVDYRQGPEHRFPAATEDVATVYRALLDEYAPDRIGIYGCSAGGLLTAQSLAWFQKEQLPRPGAVGIFCAGASGNAGTDSFYYAMSLDPFYLTPPPGVPARGPGPAPHAYMTGVDPRDPLVFPAVSPQVLAQFPPTLIITGTRDFTMSSAVSLHSQLVALQVDTRLHVWEGMWHAFLFQPDLPESRQAYSVISRFFDLHLGH